MANWNGLILTDLGRNLQARVEAGQLLLTLTKFKLGNGAISGSQTLEGLTDLVSPKQIVTIGTCTPNTNGTCTITGVITNTGLENGYELKELGVFAQDGENEILYAITVDTHPDYLQAEGGATVVSEEFNLNIAISNTSNVTAVINTAGLATIGNINTLINEHNTNKDAHQNGIKGNAATATKLQTARKINGVSFDGTVDITITDDTKQPYYSDNIKIEGDANKYYCVGFNCSNGYDGTPVRLNIRRHMNVDENSKGFLDFEMTGISGDWGGCPRHYITKYYGDNFVAKADIGNRDRLLLVWLRGQTTYYWGCTHSIKGIVMGESGVLQNDTIISAITSLTLPKGVAINGVSVATTNQVVRTDADSVMDNSSTPKVIHGATGKDWGLSWNPSALTAYDWTNSRTIWNYEPSSSKLALMPTSGIVVSPTPDSTDNSTKVATTAFVQAVSKANSTGIVASSLGETGWVKFANGLIIQWSKGGYGIFNFPIAFPNEVFRIISGRNGDGPSVTCVKSYTLSNVTFWTEGNESSSVHYIAIGN